MRVRNTVDHIVELRLDVNCGEAGGCTVQDHYLTLILGSRRAAQPYVIGPIADGVPFGGIASQRE
jgi:hypothetical protein